LKYQSPMEEDWPGGIGLRGSWVQMTSGHRLHNAERGPRRQEVQDRHPIRPGAQLRPGDALFKADVQDAYHHLRLRRCDRDKLLFRIAGRWFRPLTLNCGLPPAPRLFAKFLRPVVHELRRQGHRVISYLADLSGAPRTDHGDSPASQADAARAGREIRELFGKLGLKLHSTRTGFQGKHALEFLGILVDTRRQLYLLYPSKLAKISQAARLFRLKASRHKRRCSVRKHSAILWTWKFGVPCGHRRPPAPAGPLRLCKRRDLKSASDDMQPESSRLGVVRRPSHQNVRGPRNLGRLPIRDPRHGRLDEGMGGRDARSTNGEREHPERRGPPVNGRRATEIWDVRTRPRALHTLGHGGLLHKPRELLAAILGLKTFFPFSRQLRAQLDSDSQVALAAIWNWTCRSPRVMVLLRILRRLWKTGFHWVCNTYPAS
jgi:hypothetical protein